MKTLLIALAMVSTAQAAIPPGAMVTPSIEFSCKGLRGVVLWSNGTLDINAKSLYMRGQPGSATIEFDNKVTLTGVREGDDLYLDDAVIRYEGKNYKCRAQ